MNDSLINQAGILSTAIESAAKCPIAVGPCACNFFVGKVAEAAGVPYFNTILKTDHDRRANTIYAFIERATGSPPSGWRTVSESEAQKLADSGRFVIGVARCNPQIGPTDPNGHGHVVIVAPLGMNRLGTGTGPWVRDSQNPKLSVRASTRFGSSVVRPIYAVWSFDLKSR
jgi:hypothetical protein